LNVIAAGSLAKYIWNARWTDSFGILYAHLDRTHYGTLCSQINLVANGVLINIKKRVH